MKGWKTERDRKSNFELVPYIKKFLAEHANQDARIYVGTDSQNLKRRKATGYVTCVAIHLGTFDGKEFHGQGVHVIYKETKKPRIYDNWTRLWGEINISYEIAEHLKGSGISVYRVDLDLNTEEIPSISGFKSQKLVASGEGLFRGYGYLVTSKPDVLFATCAADTLIHRISWKKVPFS